MAAGQRSQASSDFCHKPHAGALLQGLERLRSNSLLVDVVLSVAGKEIPCHRNVLAACSEYFNAMFCNGLRESKEHKVTIHEVSASTMQLLVDYAYTSKVTITEHNAVKLLEGANFFQIQPVFDACTEFLSEHLLAENCLRMLDLGSMLSPELEKKALPFAMNEFAAVNKTPEFFNLRKDQLITLLSSDDLNASEETVYTAVMAWINHDTRKRKKEMRELMELVRFPYMDRMYFLENVENDSAVRKSCPDIMTETRRYQLFPGEVQSPRTRPRRASGLREAVVVIGGIEREERDGDRPVYSDSIIMTCSAEPSSATWTPLTSLKQNNKYGIAVAVLGTSDIIVSEGGPSGQVWLYHLELDNWAKLAPMNTARREHKLAVVQGKVYAIGGKDDNGKLASVEIYDRNLNKWTEGVALPQPRYKHAAAALNGNIYVIGGCENKCEKTSTVFRFRPGDSQWQLQSDIPVTCRNMSSSVLNGNIYVAGFPGIYSFIPGVDGGSWSEVTGTGFGRCLFGMTVFGGKLYFYGGKYTCGRGSTSVCCLDPETESLEHAGDMPKGLYGHGCVTILKGDRGMMAAGQRSPAASDFCHEPHAGALLQGLERLRSNSLLVDVVLCVAGKEIPCHRNVLAACSEYFNAMFCNGLRESKEHKVTIHEVSASTMQLLVDYAYTSKVTITEHTAVKLLEGANFFQIQPVFDACTKFLSEHLCAENCLSMLDLGGMLSPELEKKALPFAMNEFAAVSKTPEFLNLRKDQLITFLSSDDLNASEETVYTAVMTWINHDTRKRKKEMRELMELVRFPYMDRMYFLENVENDSAVRKSCPDIMTETRRYQLFPGEVQSPRTRPRRASGLREAVLVIGGTEREFPFSVYSDSIMMTCSAEPLSTTWTPLTSLRQKNMYGIAVAVLGTSDIIVSMTTGWSPILGEVWLYHLELDNWSKLAPMNATRDLHKLAVVQGKVYAIGGYNNNGPVASVEVYDRSLNKWTDGVALPQPRYRHAAATLDGNIHVIGGCKDRCEKTSTVYRFSPGDSQWQLQSDIPVPCCDMSSSVLSGNIYVSGSPGTYSFMPGEDGGSWSEVRVEGLGTSLRGMTVFGGKLYIFGGKYTLSGDGSTFVYCLDPETESLEHAGYMPKGLYGHGCVTILKG
ncbi:uncharacterized protein [Branchiostoma lanceolatum]|uniref:uncharacterized protein n=1 Tax=Branchiostoma lanceolatum TaxID=7740 RepID=UPI003451692B